MSEEQDEIMWLLLIPFGIIKVQLELVYLEILKKAKFLQFKKPE
jgi:hypothetical protein